MPIHPLLFGIFPLLSYYAVNTSELSPSVLYTPLAVVLAVSGIVWGLSNIFFRSISKGALFASSFLLLFFSHRHIVEVVKISGILGDATQGAGYHILTAWLYTSFLVLLGIHLFVKKKPENWIQITGFLNVLSIVLVVSSVVRVVYAEVHPSTIPTLQHARNIVPTTQLSNRDVEKPDIYYLIFDRYGNGDTLRKDYDFDNTSFLTWLERKGFYIAQRSAANYPKTHLSLASSLNMIHLSDLSQYIDVRQKDEELSYRLIEDNAVAQILKKIGYTFVFFESRYPPLIQNKHADQTIPLKVGSYSFSYAFLETTALEPFVRNVLKRDLFDYHVYTDSDQRTNHLNQAAKIIDIATDSRPTYTFAHFLLPHDPYVYNANCQSQIKSRLSAKLLYREQLQCANKIIAKIVNGVLEKSPIPPIIIIQSDEGPFSEKEFGNSGAKVNWRRVSDGAIRQHMRILNTYLLPGVDYKNLYPAISPVNTFRIIFNHYFGAKLPLLPDKSYIIPDVRHPYQYIDVTQTVRFE